MINPPDNDLDDLVDLSTLGCFTSPLSRLLPVETRFPGNVITFSNSGPLTSSSVNTTDNLVAHHSLSSISGFSPAFASIRPAERFLDSCLFELAELGRERGDPRDDRSKDCSQRDRSLKIERVEGIVPGTEGAVGGRERKIVLRFVKLG